MAEDYFDFDHKLSTREARKNGLSSPIPARIGRNTLERLIARERADNEARMSDPGVPDALTRAGDRAFARCGYPRDGARLLIEEADID